jgi:transposase
MPYYDEGAGERDWRALDLGTLKVYLHSHAPRIRCHKHGVLVASVPWARHDAWFTYDFEKWATWVSLHTNRSVVASLCRIEWATVGAIISRVEKDERAKRPSPFDNLTSIGIDETSYKKGHKYLTVVVNHDTGEVLWATKGHGKAILSKFFDSLTKEQRASIKAVTADGARWITECVNEYLPNAKRLLDAFHIVAWATEALEAVRRRIWNNLGRSEKKEKLKVGRPKKGTGTKPSKSTCVKGARFTVLKNPEDLTETQKVKLEMLALENGELYRAYKYKERLRLLLKMGAYDAEQELAAWLASSCHSRIPEIVELSKKIRRHRMGIIDTVASGLSNARVEAINNKIKLSIKMAYGFRNIDNLIALIMLRSSNLQIGLPGRCPHAKAA